MNYQAIFKRYELKYLMTRQQKEQLLQVMKPYMALDNYGHTTIRNIYYDTDNFRLIRHSLEKPVYKEKLRVRSYQQVTPTDNVFVELKKKYCSVVYKRRVTLPEASAASALISGTVNADQADSAQIAAEINYFCQYYQNLHPAVFLSYEREAFYSLDGSDFRITFDEAIRYRQEELTLTAPIYGTTLLADDMVLMEVKTPGGIPLWLTQFLTLQKIYKTSFSKYGAAYKDIFSQYYQGGFYYA